MTVEVAEMRSQSLRSALALDALPDPVLVMDAESRIVLSNRRAVDLLVAEPDDSQGRRHAVETNNLFFSAFRARAILQSDQPATARELLMVDPVDGSDLLFEVLDLPFRDAGSEVERRIYVMRDITDLKLAAHELEIQISRSLAAEYAARRETEKLNVIIENAGVPIVVTDRQTNIVLMNPEAESLLEVGPSGSTGSTSLHQIKANDAKLAGFLNDFLLQSRRRREARISLVAPDNAKEFPALVVSTKILDERSEPTAVVTVLRDLTQEVDNQRLAAELRRLNAELGDRVLAATRELEQRNRELEERRAELERASRMKSEFLATMSHELRTPINAMIGYNSLLREGLFGALTGKQEDALDRMKRAAEHLLSLVNDVLDLSRVEAGQVYLCAEEIDLRGFLDGLSESVRPLAIQKSLTYSVEVDPDLPSIMTDATRLRQVLLNLLSNAVKFTDSGSVALRAAPNGTTDRVRIDVLDTGIGIDEAHRESIFEQFTQADQSATRSRGGAGLGLAISRKLVRMMGGTLDVESTFGEGSTFSVELPLVPPTGWVGSDPEVPSNAPRQQASGEAR
jgi:PAS domain S-box-containing protein